MRIPMPNPTIVMIIPMRIRMNMRGTTPRMTMTISPNVTLWTITVMARLLNECVLVMSLIMNMAMMTIIIRFKFLSTTVD